MKNKQSKSTSFYSNGGVALLITVAVIIAALCLTGMYALGVIKLPDFISNIFENPDETVVAPIAGNIAEQSEEVTFYEALPREEYADALADIITPDCYYRKYNISLFFEDTVCTTEYNAIYKSGDWWVQTSENDVILTTTVCKDGTVKISDNADNTSVIDASGEIGFSEYFGYMPISEITKMINALAKGEKVEYASGIADFSLSFTQARGTGENIFIFNFKRTDGYVEEYTFAFESATMLSVIKYAPTGEKIYQMETKDSRNNIDSFDIDSLFVID